MKAIHLLFKLFVPMIFLSCNFIPKESEDDTTPIEPSAITSVSIDSFSGKLAMGDNALFTVSVLPEDALTTVTWSSSDITIATIDTNGTITSLKPGIVEISAASTQDDLIRDTQTVKVGYEETFTNSGSWYESASDNLIDDSIDFYISDGVYNIGAINNTSVVSTKIVYPFLVDGWETVYFEMPYKFSVDCFINPAMQTAGTVCANYIKFNSAGTGYNEWDADVLWITSSGYIKISHAYQDSWPYPYITQWNDITDWIQSDAINTDGSKNRLTILQSDTSLTISVNGTEIGTFPHYFPFDWLYTAAEVPFTLGVCEMSETPPATFEVVASYDNIEIYPID